MYEARVHPLIPRERFARRVLLHFAAALAVLSVSLAMGMVGYEYFETCRGAMHFSTPQCSSAAWGQSTPQKPTVARCSLVFMRSMLGLVFLAAAGLVLAPILHRLLHRFHWEQDR